MKKNKNIWIFVVVIAVAFLIINQSSKKEGIEHFEINEFMDSHFIGVDSNEVGYMLFEFPAMLSSEGRYEIDKINEDLTEYGFSYTFPYSISDCVQLKSEADQLINVAKNEIRTVILDYNQIAQQFSSADANRIINNFETNLLSKVRISEVQGADKTTYVLKLPTDLDFIKACDRFRLDFPVSNTYPKYPTYSNEDRCACWNDGDVVPITEEGYCESGNYICTDPQNILEAFDELCYRQEWEEYLDFFKPFSLTCEGDFAFFTNSPTRYETFQAYDAGSNPTFESYRNYYMNNLGDGDLVSTFELGACFIDSDCYTGETCISNKCVTSSICTNGETRCLGNNLQTCVSGYWSTTDCADTCGKKTVDYECIVGDPEPNEGDPDDSNTTLYIILGAIAVGAMMLIKQ